MLCIQCYKNINCDIESEILAFETHRFCGCKIKAYSLTFRTGIKFSARWWPYFICLYTPYGNIIMSSHLELYHWFWSVVVCRWNILENENCNKKKSVSLSYVCVLYFLGRQYTRVFRNTLYYKTRTISKFSSIIQNETYIGSQFILIRYSSALDGSFPLKWPAIFSRRRNFETITIQRLWGENFPDKHGIRINKLL